jgi:hypothetical protein
MPQAFGTGQPNDTAGIVRVLWKQMKDSPGSTLLPNTD